MNISGEWDDFTEESFDSPDCKCSQLENHVHCPIHGVSPWGGQLADKHKVPTPSEPQSVAGDDMNEICKGFTVSIRTHTSEGVEKLESPDFVRAIIGTSLDKVGVSEEVDYTLEVRRIYESN